MLLATIKSGLSAGRERDGKGETALGEKSKTLLLVVKK